LVASDEFPHGARSARRCVRCNGTGGREAGRRREEERRRGEVAPGESRGAAPVAIAAVSFQCEWRALVESALREDRIGGRPAAAGVVGLQGGGQEGTGARAAAAELRVAVRRVPLAGRRAGV